MMKVLCVIVACIMASMLVGSSDPPPAIPPGVGPCVAYFYPCLLYMTSKGDEGMPPKDCCDGLKRLESEAKTQKEREKICSCMAMFYRFNHRNITHEQAMAVNSKCGANIPYLSPKTDCPKYVNKKTCFMIA